MRSMLGYFSCSTFESACPFDAVMYAMPSSTSWKSSNSFSIFSREPGTYFSIASMYASTPEGIVTSITPPSL